MDAIAKTIVSVGESLWAVFCPEGAAGAWSGSSVNMSDFVSKTLGATIISGVRASTG